MTATLAAPPAEWTLATADAPCYVCQRSDGCRSNDKKIACVWYPRHHLAQSKTSPDRTNYGLFDWRTFRHVPPIDAAVDLLLRYFFSRTDLVAFKPPWDASACPVDGDDALHHLLQAHLGGPRIPAPWHTARKRGQTSQAGRWRIGSYSPAPDATTRWVVVDFDGGGDHAAPLVHPTAVALTTYRQFWSAGIPAYLERSRSGAGWHLWVFFAEPIAAAKARRMASALLPEDALDTEGNAATLEVFPKRDDLNGCRVGNQVWLPWYCEAVKGGNEFYCPRDGRLVPFIPTDFETAKESKIDDVLSQEGT